MIQWLMNAPGGWVIQGAVLAAILAAIWNSFRKARVFNAANRLIAHQYDVASPDEVSEVVNWAEQRGKKEWMLEQLAEIRRCYGHAGLVRGHLMWLLDVAEGKLPQLTPPPDLRRRE